MNIFLSKTDTYIFRVLKIFLATCLAVPLLASASFIFPYTAPKVFAFRVLVEISAALYFYLALKHQKIFCHSGQSVSEEPESAIKKSGCWIKSGMTINIAVLIFLFINFLSAILGADFYASFWGNLERGMGVWGLLHFVAWFLMLVGIFRIDVLRKQIPPSLPLQREEKNIIPPFLKGGRGGFNGRNFSHQLMRVSVVVSVLISLLAIGQHFFDLGDLLPRVDRVYATLGNAGVLASYLIFNIFLAGYSALSELVILRERSDRRIYFFVSCILVFVSCLALALSGTRGAYFGLGAGIVIGLAFFISFGEKKIKKYGAIFLVAVFILAGLVFLFRGSSFIKNNSVLSRLVVVSLADSTIQSRLILWQDSWRAWQSKPALGFGPENFETAVTPYLSSRLAGFEAYGIDRAHNFIFNYGVTVGWFGLLSYLVLMGAAGWALWQQRKGNLIFCVVFVSLLTAYLVQNSFIFDSFVSFLMLFFVLAVIMGSNFSTGEVRRSAQNPSHSPFAKGGEKQNSPLFKRGERGIYSPLYKKLILSIFLFFIIFSLYSFNLKPLLAAYRGNQILSLPPENAAQTTWLLKDALDLNTFVSSEVAYQVVIDYIEKIGQNPALAQNGDFYGVASAALEQAIRRSPGRYRDYVVLAWLNLYFSGSSPERINRALDLGEAAMAETHARKDAYLVLVAGYILSGQPQKAQAIVGQAAAVGGKIEEEVRDYYEKLK